jgi:hypothetical protein
MRYFMVTVVAGEAEWYEVFCWANTAQQARCSDNVWLVPGTYVERTHDAATLTDRLVRDAKL